MFVTCCVKVASLSLETEAAALTVQRPITNIWFNERLRVWVQFCQQFILFVLVHLQTFDLSLIETLLVIHELYYVFMDVASSPTPALR